MIYSIEKGRSHLVSTIHVLRADERLPDDYVRLQKSADEVIFEADLDGLHEVDLDRLGALDARTSLSELLPAKLYIAVSRLWKEWGLEGRVGKIQPWCIALALDHAMMVRSGFASETGVDRQLWDATSPDRRRWLESTQRGFEPFVQTPRGETLHMLRVVALTTDLARDRLIELHRAWVQRDFDAFTSMLDRAERETPSHIQGLQARNKEWIPIILQGIESGKRGLYAVGALHFIGPGSLPELLQNAGVACERVG